MSKALLLNYLDLGLSKTQSNLKRITRFASSFEYPDSGIQFIVVKAGIYRGTPVAEGKLLGC